MLTIPSTGLTSAEVIIVALFSSISVSLSKPSVNSPGLTSNLTDCDRLCCLSCFFGYGFKVYDPKKRDDKLHGPYVIQETRTNRTIAAVRTEIGNVLETYDIRKLEPYKGPAIVSSTRVVYQG